MSMMTLSKGLLALVVRRYGGPFWMRRRWLQRTQWLSTDELNRLQLRLLQKQVRHAYDTVPYYRGVMDQRGIRPDSIQSLGDMARLPVIGKKDVLAAGPSILSTKYARWTLRQVSTSGTTGAPMPIFRNLFSIGNEHAFVRRQWDWAGIGLSDRCAYLKGRVITRTDTEDGRLYEYDPIMKELHLSTYHLTPQRAPEYIDIMKRYHVKALIGYPSSIYPLALACLDHGMVFTVPSVLLTAETLVPSHRKVIAEAFGCNVFDFYGSAERVCYIFTCEKGSYHLQPEYGLTELLDVEGGQEGQCRIVATGFWNTAMPLLRYDTGDMVIRSEARCACGRAFPVVQSILGREGDVIRTPSGRILGASLVTHWIYVICDAKHFLESQVIQDAPDHITIEYVPAARCSAPELKMFEERLHQYLPRDLHFSLREVAAVERTRGGKIRPIVSRL